MSYRKTKLIQERNILLERKYILEQTPAPAPPAPAPAPPAPVSPTPMTGETQEKKFTKTQIESALHCSKKPFKIDTTKYEKKEEKIDGKIYVYYLTEKKDAILCRAENKEK